jgi:5-methylcytosine-specific restriction protein A
MAQMTAREVSEWIGRTPDTPVPPRVKDRILKRQEDKCQYCGRPFSARLKPIFDHRPALINGGENRESKTFAGCEFCHTPLTEADVAEKSKVADVRKKNLGLIEKRPWPKRDDAWGTLYRAKLAALKPTGSL